MAENKTKENEASVPDFLESVADEQKKKDSYELLEIFETTTGFPPKMWGGSIIGFGSYHYKYASGREGDFLLVGFSPRKNAISLYLSCDIENQHRDLIGKLGKFKNGKSCIYIKSTADIDMKILKELIRESILFTQKQYASI